MLKKVLFATVAFGSFGMSKDVNLEKFSGIEVGYERVEAKNVIGSTESNLGVELGFRTGVQNYDWRTAISGHFFKKDEQEYIKALISFDKFVGVGLYESEDTIMKPYIGVHSGWLNYKNTGQKVNGLIYGVESGVVWALSNGADIDFGYRFSSSEVGRVDNIGTFSLAINYIF
jgi:hypothetical protein